MSATRWKQILVLALAAGLLAAGAGLIAQTRNDRPGGEPAKGRTAKAPAGDRAGVDRARLQGEWVFDAAESGEARGGRQIDLMGQFWNARATFRGNEVRVTHVKVPTPQGFQTVNVRAGFVLDPAHRPKHIDVELKAGLPGGALAGTFQGKGIYEIDGDTLRLCVPRNGAGGRPAEFKATPGSNRYLLVLKRVPKTRHPDAQAQTGAKGLTVRLVDTRGKPVVLAKVGTRRLQHPGPGAGMDLLVSDDLPGGRHRPVRRHPRRPGRTRQLADRPALRA